MRESVGIPNRQPEQILGQTGAQRAGGSLAIPGARRGGGLGGVGDWESEFFQRDRGIPPPALTPEYKTSVLRSPRQPLLSLQNSLSEVTGPLFGHSELGP